MGTRNDDISLILAKAKKQGFLPDVSDNEVAILEKEAVNLFKNDRMRSMKGADGCLYQPSSTSLLKWRSIRQEVLANKKQGHIAIIGDSIAFGAAATGASNPKHLNSWPGQLRTMLNKQYGDAGSGIVTANPNVRANPAWDPRFTFGGASFVDHTFGLYSSASYRLNGASDATLDFTDVAEEFWIYTLSGLGTFTVQVDAGSIVTVNNVASGGGALPRETGYYNNGTNAINVFKVTTGSNASHTLKIRPSVTSGQNLFVMYVEARVTGNGKFRISNAAQSSKSLTNIVTSAGVTNTGDDTGLSGHPPVDTLKADLLVLGLGVNDWQGQTSLTNSKLRMQAIINRQRASTASAGTVPANGDVVLLWNPKPDTATLGGGNYINPTWDEYRNLFYEVAEEMDVALIDLGERWRDYTTANSYGLYADTIHPGDKGAGDIAGSVYRALFVEA